MDPMITVSHLRKWFNFAVYGLLRNIINLSAGSKLCKWELDWIDNLATIPVAGISCPKSSPAGFQIPAKAHHLFKIFWCAWKNLIKIQNMNNSQLARYEREYFLQDYLRKIQ